MGHSERRHTVAHESSELIAEKTRVALDKGLKVVLCVGELKEEREADRVRPRARGDSHSSLPHSSPHCQTMDILQQQLSPVIAVLRPGDWQNLVVAYEPVWAIGTGLTATPEVVRRCHRPRRCCRHQLVLLPALPLPPPPDCGRPALWAPQAQETHKQLRDWLAGQTSGDVASTVRIVYGGSVKAGNCADLITQPDIDGAKADPQATLPRRVTRGLTAPLPV